MSDGDPQTTTVNVDTASKPGTESGASVLTSDLASQAATIQESTLIEDPNPRSPKRRRTSPEQDDTEVDFEAAAARALAISLGVDPVNISPISASTPAQQNGASHAPSASTSQNTLPPDQQARIDNLSTIDDLATQLLSTLAKMNHLEIGEMLFGPPSQRGQDYRALKAKFEQAKRIYLTNSPFVSPHALGLKEADQIDTLRKINMATFMASIFSGEIGLRIMDINFLDVFVSEGGRLLKAPASIYLELKTQAFIAAKRTAPAMLNQVMLDLFPNDMEKYLVAKRPGAKSLAPTELDFLKRLGSRRDILYSDMRNNRLDNLESRYRWDDFSREVNSYLSKNYDQSSAGNRDKIEEASPNPARTQLQQDQMEGQFSLSSNQPLQESMPAFMSGDSDVDFNIDDFMAQAARAAEIALQGDNHTAYAAVRPEDSNPPQTALPPPAPPPAAIPSPIVIDTPTQPDKVRTPTPPTQQRNHEILPVTQTEFQQYKPVTVDSSTITSSSLSENGGDSVPHRSQTAPTQVLYERARLVTTSKVPPLARKPNPPSHRRPWTNEEENALMTGLDQVKGPHWSQILAMYGPGGTINESLKDRNQVQLKDKARNLKLFFLKAGIEVPYYLQAVTGDLKTRAPAQAEKREARERERVNAEEDDLAVGQDGLPLELTDDLDLVLPSVTDQEDNQESTPTAYQTVDEQQDSGIDTTGDGNDDVFDMEAMVARAAASVTQSLQDSWQ